MRSWQSKAEFAGRNVKVTASSIDFRGKSADDLNEYSSADLLGTSLASLMQRVLPRHRLDELLTSQWLQRRTQAGWSLDRKEIHTILRLIALHGDNWLEQLGESFNLANKSLLLNSILNPVYEWWCEQDEQHKALVLAESDLKQSLNELTVQLEFWNQQSESSVVELVNTESSLSLAKYQQVKHEYEQVFSDLDMSFQALKQRWPHWQQGEKTWLSSGDLSAFAPVPRELAPFWKMLSELEQDISMSVEITGWLQPKGLCLSADKFIWEPLKS